jgi:4-hydroxy-3-methylbut-2-enyl diphosphate reductase IspH
MIHFRWFKLYKKSFPLSRAHIKKIFAMQQQIDNLRLREIANKIEALLVVGAPNSSNSKRLVEVGKRAGCNYSQLVQRAVK